MFKKIYIEITNSCNLNCSFCSKSKRKIKQMTLDEFEYILKQITSYTKYIYLHVKGEPLIHTNIVEFLQLAEKYQIKVNLTTNGTLFPLLVDKIKDISSLHKINFSLHSENNYSNYLENIFENVNKLSPKTTVIYRLWTLKDNKLDNKSTQIVDKIIKYYNLSTETVEKLKNAKNIKISSTIYVDKDNEFKWPEISNNNSCGYCHALKTHIAILSDGTVVPCCLDAEGIINLGNIFATSLEEIINSKRYQALKKSFQDRNPSEQLCKSCTFKLKF